MRAPSTQQQNASWSFRAFCFLILARIPIAYSGTASSSSSILDLSYKHYVDATNLEDAIRSKLWDLDVNERPEDLTVDISYSILGNDKKELTGIFKSLLPTAAESKENNAIPPETVKPPTQVSFRTRGNRITPKIMDDLLLRILHDDGKEQSTKKDSGNDSEQESQKEDGGSGIQEEKKAENSSRATTTALSWTIGTLDVGWNELRPESIGWKKFLNSLEKLIQSRSMCPHCLRLDRCGLVPGACRAIGKGIIHRYESAKGQVDPIKELSIYLCGNPDLGDSGSAAIAAAIRMVITDEKFDGNSVILGTLDLSACNVGDAGAKALALALESSPGLCIRHLNLSNNKITDEGAAALGHALASSVASGRGTPVLESLDLSGNVDIRDQAASALADAVGKGLLSSITLRSCHILADGAAAFGKALKNVSKRDSSPYTVLQIDLSGNPLGVLRGKTSKGNKYSASAIKSKASATTAAYMNMIRKGVKTGLKGYGVDMGSTVESDDEEEAREGLGSELVNSNGDLDPKSARCGIKAFSSAILDNTDDEESEEEQSYPKRSSPIKIKLGMRRCFIDHSAADALAAVFIHATDEMGVDLALDVGMNPVLEDEMVEALEGNKLQDMILRDMAERHMDALEALRVSRERAAEAAESAAARIRAEADFESQWDAPDFAFDDGEEDDDWDSDADYEREDESDY